MSERRFFCLLTTAALCVFLTACSVKRQPPGFSRKDWISFTTRHYQDVTEDQIFEAAEKLLRLADGDDFKIVHAPRRMAASRFWMVYAVFAVAQGTDHWLLESRPVSDGVNVLLSISTSAGGYGPWIDASGGTAMALPTNSSIVDSTAIYDLFWARLDYLLRKNKDWRTCEDQDKLSEKDERLFGGTEQLCSVTTKDELPEELRKVQQPTGN